MTIVVDMDNTLTDELGATVRPGVREFLEKLLADGHKLILWTNSRKQRAAMILLDHNLKRYFSKFIFREDYDPAEKGLPKDIRKVDGDILLDDDPAEIEYVRTLKKEGHLLVSYRKGMETEPDELDRIYRQISRKRFKLF